MLQDISYIKWIKNKTKQKNIHIKENNKFVADVDIHFRNFLLRMSTSAIQFSSKLFLNFLKLNHIHIIEYKFTKYYINVYTCYRIFTTTNGSRIKANKKLYIKIKK